MPSIIPEHYSVKHKSFLQLLMNRKMLCSDEALALYKKVFSSTESMTRKETLQQMEQAISLINLVVKDFNLEVRSAEHEMTCEKYYLLINTASNLVTGKLNKYSATELEFFKKVLYEIVTSEEGEVSSVLCLNLDCLPPELTKSDRESLIDKFCRDKWLEVKDGKICLSLLSIVELDPLLQESYDEIISKCHLCKRTVIKGYRCENCISLMHLHCLRRYTKGNDSPCCPNCGGDQPEMLDAIRGINVPEEEEEVQETQETPVPSTSGTRKRSRRRT